MTHEENRFPDLRRLFLALSPTLGDWLEEAIRKRRKASIALAGGATPGPLYQELSHIPLKWDKVTVTLTDERWVTPEDPASNEYLIRDRLLHRRAEAANFVPFKTDHPTPAAASATISRRLSPDMPLDICLLGMGADGHVASLIPGADGYDEGCSLSKKKIACAIHAANAAGAPERMSLSLSAILSSRRIVLLFTGKKKMRVFEQAKAQEGTSPVRTILAQSKTPVHTYWAP